jgi:IS5 family transposase
LIDKTNTASSVWADTAYRSRSNEAHLEGKGFTSKILFRRRQGVGLTPSHRKANRARAQVRSAVETVLAAQKHRFGWFVRIVGLARARVKIGLANLDYNFGRLIGLEKR